MEATKIVFLLLTVILVATDAKPAGRGKDTHVSLSFSTFCLLLIFSVDLTDFVRIWLESVNVKTLRNESEHINFPSGSSISMGMHFFRL